MLDLEKYFSAGEIIEMNYIDARGHINKYRSQVVEVHENGFIDTLIPIHKRRDIYLRKDAVLKLIVGKEEAIYELKAAVSEKLFGRIPLLRLKVFPEVRKIQRRDFYRLRILRDIGVRLVKDVKGEESDKYTCGLIDISVGGLLFSSRKEFNENDKLEISLNLNNKKLNVHGIIVRRTLNDIYSSSYFYGVKFVNMNEPDKNIISRYIFEEQRKLIKKGLI